MRRVRACFAATVIAAIPTLVIEAQSILTVAGGGTDDYRPATLAAISRPTSMALDSEGNLFIVDTDFNVVRHVDVDTKIITTFAGTRSAGFGGDGEPATKATFFYPSTVALDSGGNFYVADTVNDRVRRIDRRTGTVSTYAGRELYGETEDGIPATQAWVDSPAGLAFDSRDNLFIVESRSNLVRRVDARSGIISTVAGSGTWGFSGDGGPATAASFRLSGDVEGRHSIAVNHGLAVVGSDLFVSDSYNNRVRKISLESGIVTTVAGTGSTDRSDDTGPATLSSIRGPVGLALKGADLLFTDVNGYLKSMSLATGIVHVLVGLNEGNDLGDGGPASRAWLGSPTDVVVGPGGDIFISDAAFNRVRRVAVDPDIISTYAGSGRDAFTGDGGAATAASLSAPAGIVLDPEGNLFIADEDQSRIRRVDAATGVIDTYAGTGDWRDSAEEGPATEINTPYPNGMAIDAEGHLYVACRDDRIRRISPIDQTMTIVAGNGEQGFSGDGGPATAAMINIRSFEIGTLALGTPAGIAIDDAARLLYFSDIFNHRVRTVDLDSGVISTYAGSGVPGFSGDGGPARSASLDEPAGVALDSKGNLFIADSTNNRIRRVDRTSGRISTIVGTGVSNFDGDGKPGTESNLSFPLGVAVSPDGTIFIADRFNNRVRALDRFGVLTTVAGSDLAAPSGDGGPATRSGLADPTDIFVSQKRDLYIADARGGHVRVIYACQAVAKPLATTPADGSSGVAVSPSLSWAAASGAFRYDVYLDTESPPRRIAAHDLETTAFSPSNLQPLTTYFWKVVAKGDQFCSPVRSAGSEIRAFTTTSKCEAPGEFTTH